MSDGPGGERNVGAAEKVAAIVLAAGASTRMAGGNKLLRSIRGEAMIARVVDAALASRCCRVTVVTGFEAERVEAVLAGRALHVVRNAEYREGMAASIRCGIQSLPATIDAALILLGDMPFVKAADLDRLIDAFTVDGEAIVAPMHAGRRGNPVLWPRRYFDHLSQLEGDSGGRQILDTLSTHIRLVPCTDDATARDIDSAEALAQANLR